MLDTPGRSVTPSVSRDELPLSIAILRWIGGIYLVLFKRFRTVDADRIPGTGSVIFVANHTTAYDPLCIQVACTHRLIRFIQAREYYEQRPIHFLYRLLKVIPVNRTGNDTTAIRTALRTLSDGGCLGIFPEGKISEDGKLHDGRKGVALLALMSNATVVPSYLHSTRPYRGMIRDFLQINRVTLYFGEPIRFDDLAGRHRDPAAIDLALKRTMDAIVALRDRYATASVSSILARE
jgi:1-acyl-sn-glycerol-3-phosphate acyltransferase